jgi:hypothetical protein
VSETSAYGILVHEFGHKLKPGVRCIMNPANRGAGIPVGGFFAANQSQKGADEPSPCQRPASGRRLLP